GLAPRHDVPEPPAFLGRRGRAPHLPAVVQRRNSATTSTCADQTNWSIAVRSASLNPPSTRIRASRAKVVGLQETATTCFTRDRASISAWLLAPARGGSNTTQSKRFRSSGGSGEESRFRTSATTRPDNPDRLADAMIAAT